MAPYNAVFNANEHAPQQAGGKHPVGNKFPFVVTGTDVKDTKDNQGKYFEVTFTSPAGSIRNNYNLWNASKQAVDIAVGQLSALCHATGIFQVDFKNDGASLRGAKGLMDIGFQAGQEPSADKPEGGYVEVKKIYDVNGNEPGKQQVQAQQPSQQAWTGNQPQQATAPQQGWSGGQQVAPNPPANSGGWQQGASDNKPPWS